MRGGLRALLTTSPLNRGNPIKPKVVRLSEAKRGSLPLPRRWVVERIFAWLSRFRRLARYYERLGRTLKGLRFVAAVILMLAQVFRWEVHNRL